MLDFAIRNRKEIFRDPLSIILESLCLLFYCFCLLRLRKMRRLTLLKFSI